MGEARAEGERNELQARLARIRAEIVAAIPTSDGPIPTEPCGLALGRRHAALVDALVHDLLDRTGAIRGQELELGAVGSYGRGALASKSDLDVRILTTDAARAGAAAESLLYPLWDLGLTIGHQVVVPSEVVEAAREDLPTATSLLDYRHLAGGVELEADLRRRAAEGVFAPSELPRFLARLEEEVSARHARFGGSVYLLEPDVKNGAGGLRDLDVAYWAAKARFNVGEPEELVRIGVLVPREAIEIQAARETLWRIRNLLHAHANRRSDRLSFDEQEIIAELLGYGEGGEAVERFMSEVYRAARSIRRALDTMLARAMPVLSRKRPRDEDLGGGVRLFDGSISMNDAELLRADPPLAFRLLTAAVERGVALYPFARDAIVRVTGDPSFCDQLRADAEAARLFVALVSTCKETALRSGTVLRELHDLGLLLAMIPEFSPVVGRVHHDTYHVYTVDVHSVAAVDRLASLARGDLAGEYPVACRVAAEIARPEVLFFATLLHDVGKAIGSSDHSQRGADMAEKILARLGFAKEDIDDAAHLIRKHLVMYHQATRRDLDDPATIDEFAREVRGPEGLRDLYLLTVCDLSTTSPTSMTSWKARMLDDLYLLTDAKLGGESAGEDRRARAVAEVLSVAGADADRPFLERFLAAMPERYLLSNAPAAIAAHAEVVRRHRAPVSIALVPSRHPEAAEICVVAGDRPGLLAAIAAAIAASRLEVHAAQIHTLVSDGERLALDLFWVRDRGEGTSGVARALPKLERDVAAISSGAVSARDLVESRVASARDRSTPEVKTRISIDDRASPRHTVIEVLTRDRPGVLYSIADTLYRLGLTIAVAKINTEGTRVADVFYVSEADGSKIERGKRFELVNERLVEALATPEATLHRATAAPAETTAKGQMG